MNRSRTARFALVAAAASLTLAVTSAAALSTTTVTVTPSPASETTNTGVTMTASDSGTVTATGSWAAASGGPYGTAHGPNGSAAVTDPFTAACLRDPAAPVGALISSLDGGATWSFVGEGPTVISGAGTLLLAQNDCPGYYGDNYGSVTATITPVVPVIYTADSCKNGGWKTIGVYKNQGDCVSFYSTGKKNPEPEL